MFSTSLEFSLLRFFVLSPIFHECFNFRIFCVMVIVSYFLPVILSEKLAHGRPELIYFSETQHDTLCFWERKLTRLPGVLQKFKLPFLETNISSLHVVLVSTVKCMAVIKTKIENKTSLLRNHNRKNTKVSQIYYLSRPVL